MSQGVFTRRKRISFVDGQETATPDPGFVACGDGTGFPMLVTLAQLAEILYRVKDAWFTAGAITWTYGGPISYPAPTTAPANRATEIDNVTYQYRGYTVAGGDDFNGAVYDAGNGVDWSDIADDERGIFWPTWESPFKDAFSYDADDPNNTQGGNSDWWGLAGAGARAMAIRGDRVAVVKDNPANGFYDPTNRYYLEFEFFWDDYNIVLGFGGGTNIYDGQSGSGDWSATAGFACNYVIRLSDSDVTCPIYFPSAYSPGGTDVIHEAMEWWPYQKLAGDVWNSGTGARL